MPPIQVVEHLFDPAPSPSCKERINRRDAAFSLTPQTWSPIDRFRSTPPSQSCPAKSLEHRQPGLP
jgi:hypothetical protein